jgi:LCP family protein required for cell wall assembly
MINPQPVNTPQSPYRNHTGSPARPTMMSAPSTPPGEQPPQKKPRRQFRWKRAFGLAFLALIVGTSTFAYAQYRKLASSIIQDHEGSTAEILSYNSSNTKSLDASKFTQYGDGRFNMVIVGVGGENHPGGNLTDSIQVLSIDTLNNSLSFTSVPRDLYVNYNGLGRTKINAVYTYAEQKKPGSGALAVREIVGQVLGIKISNFAMIDFTGIKQIVDALGGIEVDVPKALNDPLYPAADMIHYDPLYVKAGPQNMNGELALKYARSRETTSDFDRSMRQQIVIAAIKKKALSVGVLTSPTRVSSLITALGKHFKTDLQVDNIRQLMDIYRGITPDNTKGFTLDTSSALGLLTSQSSPAYVAYPVLGLDRYEAINQWFAQNNPDPLLSRESPSVTLYNSGKATQKQMDTFAEKLKDYGYTVTVSTTVPTNKPTATKILAKNPTGKPISHNYLGSLLKATVEKGQVTGNANTDYEIIYIPSVVTPASIPKAPTPTPTKTPTPSPTPTPIPTPTPSPTDEP